MDELFTVEQVANKLKIHLMTVYKMLSSGRLKAARIPGVGLRIEAKELEKLFSQNTRGSYVNQGRRTNAKSRK